MAVIKFVYAGERYDSAEEAQAQVSGMRDRLDNKPTSWIKVKTVVEDGPGNWVISPTVLTDEQLNNLDSTKRYMAASVLEGENLLGLTSQQVYSRISSYRLIYAKALVVNTIFKTDVTCAETIPPREDLEYLEIATDIDMSDYL